MPVKVSFIENESIIVIESSGQLLRREAGWGAERVGEILRQHAVTGILADSTLVQEQESAALSGEMISGFIQAIEADLAIAYIRPTCWSEAYGERVRATIEDAPMNCRVFDDVDAGRAWLREAATSRVSPA
ncbi:hypothetical protein [uncultured Maricaulis sp.]|uniref:hypothetical protein n=1 Tax=uncultured Maricaulis sp. TaxID=174710 RepID=UPI0030D9B749|tara:strand:- start:52928 stop:53320 length:393 start_codon:yes stop_codon:yes gene_type:complete